MLLGSEQLLLCAEFEDARQGACALRTAMESVQTHGKQC